MSAPPDKPKGAAKVAAILAAAALAAPLTIASEGLIKRTYPDPVGIPTACYGHTGADVVAGRTYSDDECLGLVARDLAAHGSAIDACLTAPVTLNMRAAFTDFAFNAGASAFCRSGVARRANAGDAKGACAELSRWIYAGGKPLPGLVKRRAAERKLCEEGLP